MPRVQRLLQLVGVVMVGLVVPPAQQVQPRAGDVAQPVVAVVLHGMMVVLAVVVVRSEVQWGLEHAAMGWQGVQAIRGAGWRSV